MQHPSGLKRGRHALESGSRLPQGALTQQVAQSWERCRDLGLDPVGPPREIVVPFSDVLQRR